ncbi:hypothetical protein L6164_021306 [Bauhinia variegata]|uniref:Uncharacterized protein n=1 Tax=Bauhinia variegata TaxID=167791 RepID=A0ACB9MZW8_BAUVA|nr:hypothetical protein L6164_021306 [Bauhinia variegata]
MEYRCVQCDFPIKTLYIQYSPGNIRLMKCEKCKSVADEYIECEIMIILIDLILHKTKAYRHLLFNVRKLETLKLEELFWKMAVGFLLLDAFVQGKSLILESCKGESGSSKGFSSLLSLSTCWKILMDVFFGNLMFLLTFLSVVRIFLSSSFSITRCKDLLFAILISSYFKIFLIAMLVWEFPSPVIFIIDLFVLSSNIVALKVMSESTMSQCVVGACFSAHVVKLSVTQLSQLTVLGHSILQFKTKCLTYFSS